VTRHPTDAWLAQQLREATPFGAAPRFLIRDNDRKYGPCFDHLAATSGIWVLRPPVRAPRANATCERFLGSVRRECLDHLLVLGERHLRQTLKVYAAYCNRARPQQGLGQRVPQPQPALLATGCGGTVVASPVLGGRQHDDQRTA
jgi:putative transposase